MGSELATDLHLEDESFSQAAMGWTRGLCIQLASIKIWGQGPGIGGQGEEETLP